MACPDYALEVQLIADANPEAFKNCHTGNEHTEDFIRIVAYQLHELDPRVGLNGKRGNPDDISDDALNVLDPDDRPGTTPDGQKCWVVDVVVGAGAPGASVTWNAFTDPEASTGAWVEPSPPPVDESATYPYPDEPTTGKAYQARVKACYTEAGRPFPDPADEDAFRHFMRYGYSCRYMPEPEASDKHIQELRADLGLPVVKD